MPLRTRNARPMQAFNRDHAGVLVHHGKYGETYYYVPTEAHLHAAALALLTSLKEQRWYDHLKFDPTDQRIYGPKHPGMEPDEIAKLPTGPIRQAAVEAWKTWEEDQEERKEADKDYRLIERAIEEQNGALAWKILQERTDGEYERVTLEWMEEPEPLHRPEKPRHGCRWTDEEGQRWIFDSDDKGRGLGWIKGAHAQWGALYAAHEQDSLEPEVTEFRMHEVLSEAWSHIYRAVKHGGMVGGEAESYHVHPEDFEAALQDYVEFQDQKDMTVVLLTDVDEAKKKGRAVFRRHTKDQVTCAVVSDPTVESIADREARWEKESQERKKKKTAS